MDELFFHTWENIFFPFFFFSSLQRVTFNKFSCYQTSPWSYLFVIPLFRAHLNFGKCLSIQCNIKSTGSKCRHWSCWQKLRISFAPVGARVIPLSSCPPTSQSGEIAAFYRSLAKYSPFVWPPVLENLLYLAFCFTPTKEYMHMFSYYFFLFACLFIWFLIEKFVLSVYGTCFLVSCAGIFPECKLWIRNTFSV